MSNAFLKRRLKRNANQPQNSPLLSNEDFRGDIPMRAAGIDTSIFMVRDWERISGWIL
jgi:hypothetical protein